MHGKSRELLNTIKHLLFRFEMAHQEIRKSNARNYHLSDEYHEQSKRLEIALEKNIKQLLTNHLHYLDTPDPYQRQPTLEQMSLGKYKKNVFMTLQTSLQGSTGTAFRHRLSHALTVLEHDKKIDTPRWPKLSLRNLYQLFQHSTHPLPKKSSDTKKLSKEKEPKPIKR